MRTIIFALLLTLIVSCTKESVTAAATANQSFAPNTAVAYKDNSISVADFKAQPGNRNIKVSFTTLYEKNIVKLEVLKGLTANHLCSIYTQQVTANSYSSINYSTGDVNDAKATVIYYMIKYTLVNGDWGYTPVFQLSL